MLRYDVLSQVMVPPAEQCGLDETRAFMCALAGL